MHNSKIVEKKCFVCGKIDKVDSFIMDGREFYCCYNEPYCQEALDDYVSNTTKESDEQNRWRQ